MTWMIEQQSQAFLVSIICGIAAGLLIGVIHELKKVISIGNVIAGLLDIVLWLGLCVSVIMVTYKYSSGNVRSYIFFGFLSGMGFYFSTINWIISKLLNYILCFAKKGLKNVTFAIKNLVDIICHKY